MIIAGYCETDGQPYNVIVGSLSDFGAGAHYCSLRCARRMKKRRSSVTRRLLGCVMGCGQPAAPGQGEVKLPLCAGAYYRLSRSCRGKVRHARQHKADRVAEKRKSGERAVTPYFCLVCEAWHLGYSESGVQAEVERIALMLRRVLTGPEIAALASYWSPTLGAHRPARRKARGSLVASAQTAAASGGSDA